MVQTISRKATTVGRQAKTFDSRRPKLIKYKTKYHAAPRRGVIESCCAQFYFAVSIFAICMMAFWGWLLSRGSLAIDLKEAGDEWKPHASRICFAAALVYIVVLAACTWTITDIEQSHRSVNDMTLFDARRREANAKQLPISKLEVPLL